MNKPLPSSFRDPSGFVFEKDGKIFRQINFSYQENYDYLMSSGLYEKLIEKGWLISHEEIDTTAEKDAYKTILPEQIPFISHPYEWCFSQLKDAALLTLQIQHVALEYGMWLKDASAFNIQFLRGKPIFIDTLSFEKIEEGKPWPAYRQFCEHFLAPIALMHYLKEHFCSLFQIYPDGIPLSFANSLLPIKSKLNLGTLFHIHLNEKALTASHSAKKESKLLGKKSLKNLARNLKETIQKFQWKPKSEWVNYYEELNADYTNHKIELVSVLLQKIEPKIVWDFGSNDGKFSRIATSQNSLTISMDSDPACVESNYLQVKKESHEFLLPLVLDIAGPSPAIGWENHERQSLIERGPVDLAMALALVHHLRIGNNVPFEKIAAFFSKTCKHLLIEFIPKSDERIQQMLTHRKDVFGDYSQENFENAFTRYFKFEQQQSIKNSPRKLYYYSLK